MMSLLQRRDHVRLAHALQAVDQDHAGRQHAVIGNVADDLIGRGVERADDEIVESVVPALAADRGLARGGRLGAHRRRSLLGPRIAAQQVGIVSAIAIPGNDSHGAPTRIVGAPDALERAMMIADHTVRRQPRAGRDDDLAIALGDDLQLGDVSVIVRSRDHALEVLSCQLPDRWRARMTRRVILGGCSFVLLFLLRPHR